MRQCERCQKWHTGKDSAVCDPCWEDMGQMRMFVDEPLDLDEPPIASHFDRPEDQ